MKKSNGLEVSQLPLREKRSIYLLMLMHEILYYQISKAIYTRFVAVLISLRSHLTYLCNRSKKYSWREQYSAIMATPSIIIIAYLERGRSRIYRRIEARKLKPVPFSGPAFFYAAYCASFSETGGAGDGGEFLFPRW